MTRFGLDYSTGRPSMAALKDAHVTFACRYISTVGNPKNLTLAEANLLSGAGIDIVANYETTAGFMLSDDGPAGMVDDGKRDATSALAQARATGMPQDRPIYFSMDFNPNTATATQWKRLADYLDGAASVLGRENVGLYGGYLAIQTLVGPKGVARWGWQTYGWSGGKWSAKAHIQQYRNGQTLGGASVDYDRIPDGVADFGQWQVGRVTALTDWFDMATKDELASVVSDQVTRILRAAVGPDDGKTPAGVYFSRLEGKLDALPSKESLAKVLDARLPEWLKAGFAGFAEDAADTSVHGSMVELFARAGAAERDSAATLAAVGQVLSELSILDSLLRSLASGGVNVDELAGKLRDALSPALAAELGRRLLTPAE